MNERNVVASRSDMTNEVIEIGYRILEFLSNCGYSSIHFSHAGHDKDGYAFFITNNSGLPRVASKHLQRPQVVTHIETYLHRNVAVVIDRDEDKYIMFIVQLEAKPELMPEPA